MYYFTSFNIKLTSKILQVIQSFHIEIQFAKKLLMSRPILFLLNFILIILSFMCYFEQKCILMLINGIFIYLSTIFIYFYIHIHVDVSKNRIFGVLEIL